MRLLVFTATYDGGMRAECRRAVLSQQTSHEWEWIIDTDDPFPTPDHRNVLAKYKRARQRALDGGFDALVTVEHDNVLPINALELLAGTVRLEGQAVGVVYAPYVLRHSAYVLSTWQYCGPNNLGMPLGLYPEELAGYRKAGVGRISGCGWGCTLIWRSTLKRVPFHDGNGQNPPGDLVFAKDCLQAGVMAVGRFDCPVGHYTDEGRLLRPYDKAPILAQVRALQDVTVLVGGHSLAMSAGRQYACTHQEAYDLERAGYVRILPPEPMDEPDEVERAILTPDAETAVSPVQRKRRKQ